MAFITDDHATLYSIESAFVNAGWSLAFVKGAFQWGGVSGNTPIGYDPDVVAPLLAQIGAGGLTSGGLPLPMAGGIAYGDVNVNKTMADAIRNLEFAQHFGASAAAPAAPAASTSTSEPNLGLALALLGALVAFGGR